jgi:hypothetical protein
LFHFFGDKSWICVQNFFCKVQVKGLLNAERKKKYQIGVHNISENVEKIKPICYAMQALGGGGSIALSNFLRLQSMR